MVKQFGYVRKYLSSLCMMLVFLFTENMYGFEVHGFVKYMGSMSPISGVQIYELYKDEPVAITDNKGEFKYETGSNSPVEIHAEKKGYYSMSGKQRITESGKTEQIEFVLTNWYEKKDPFKIYIILEGDKNCILNIDVTLSGQCKNTANEYNPSNLNPDQYNCGATVFLYPNSDGAVIIRHLVPSMSFFGTPLLGGGIIFLQEPNDVYYNEVSQDALDKYVDNRKQWFEFGRSLGYYNEYKGFDEYKTAYKKNIYKYCPSKLNEIEYSDQKSLNTNQHVNLEDKQDAYDAAHENEQSTANKTLTALTTAATGIGGMELARGLSEQKADKEAEQDMTAYLETFRCTYGDGNQVKAGPETIELPGGNDETMMQLRAEYFALANDLKERKAALGMKPGIESEEIKDKAQMGLYDNENIGITNGAYASLYRAMALGSETDQAKIDEEQKASKNRVIAGAVVGGVGVVGGMVGNSLINGKLGELIKDKNNKSNNKYQSQDVVPWETEPKNCSYSECLSKLTISERTKTEPRYYIITDFCSKQFPNNPDCEKIMLMYSENPLFVLDVDTLLANNYDIDFFQRATKDYCDWSVCTDDEIIVDTVLFSDRYYEYTEHKKENLQLKIDLEKCFKIAGASNYFDLPISIYNGKQVDIDFTKLDCSKLDDSKTDEDIKVKGIDVTKFLGEKPYQLWERVQLLFGKQSGFVHILKNN